MKNAFELEFTESDQLNKPEIITRHSALINQQAEKFLVQYFIYLENYKNNLNQENYQDEIVTIDQLLKESNEPDKLRLFIHLPDKVYAFENLIIEKILREHQTFKVNWIC
ncbi:hypothetical protein F8M41_010161 [Gigaspora margarita]|uniref:Uncharacterized protein n=1 Tax=Gigaspora margarita TaxID=4874 RepID=A0A8H3X1F4_GIGMA|nr:hypothetical protein F8M41_010161 [Gigaspora margarita]